MRRLAPGTLRLLMNLWPPFRAGGVRVREISPDYRHVRVELVRRWFGVNANYVGTHFGGNLFAMTDPFYMLMYLHNLGDEYMVWDKSARIEFLRPGRGTVAAEFCIDDDDLAQVRRATAGGERHLRDHTTDVVDSDGEVVARVQRTVYFRLKPRYRPAGAD